LIDSSRWCGVLTWKAADAVRYGVEGELTCGRHVTAMYLYNYIHLCF